MPNFASYVHLHVKNTHQQKEAFVSFEAVFPSLPIYLLCGSAALLHREVR